MEMRDEILEARFSQEQIVRKYNRIASIYDLFGLMMAAKAREKALDMAAIRNGERVLEVAFGTGLNFLEILRRNPDGRVEGIDVSMGMLRRANKRIAKTGHRNYALFLSDCRHLPFDDNSFDLLMNLYLLDILPVEDFLPILMEFKRVLKDHGRIILVNTTKGDKWINQIYETIYRLKPPIVAGSRGIIAQPYLKKIGFQETRREVVCQLTFPSEIVVGIKK